MIIVDQLNFNSSFKPFFMQRYQILSSSTRVSYNIVYPGLGPLAVDWFIRDTANEPAKG